MVVRFLVCAGLVTAALPSAAFADDPPITPEEAKELRETVRRLEGRVAELEGKDWPRERMPGAQPGSAIEEAVRSIRFSGYVEEIYSWNLRHGSSVPGRRGDTIGFNQLRAGDEDENGFVLRNVRLQAEKVLAGNGSTGFRVQVDYGRAAEIENVDPNFGGGETLAVPEANFSWRAPFKATDHVDFTVGRFRTWLGFETFESDQNWLVTRNPIAVFATPVTHNGLRAVAPIADKVEAGLAFVNGWDEMRDMDDGKTGLARLAFGPYDECLNSTFQLIASYGSVEGGPQSDHRRLFEVIWSGNLNECTEFALDGVWGDMPGRDWHGAAAYLRYRATDSMTLAGRLGWYADDALGTDGARVVDATLSVTWVVAENVQAALEYRHDWSESEPFLDESGDPEDSQDTLTASFIYRF